MKLKETLITAQTSFSDAASCNYGSLSSRGVYSSQQFYPEKESLARQDAFSRWFLFPISLIFYSNQNE